MGNFQENIFFLYNHPGMIKDNYNFSILLYSYLTTACWDFGVSPPLWIEEYIFKSISKILLAFIEVTINISRVRIIAISKLNIFYFWYLKQSGKAGENVSWWLQWQRSSEELHSVPSSLGCVDIKCDGSGWGDWGFRCHLPSMISHLGGDRCSSERFNPEDPLTATLFALTNTFEKKLHGNHV